MTDQAFKPTDNKSKLSVIIMIGVSVLLGIIAIFSLISSKENEQASNTQKKTETRATNTAPTTSTKPITTYKIAEDEKGEFSSIVVIKPFNSGGVSGPSKLPEYTGQDPDPAISVLSPSVTAQNFEGQAAQITPGKKPYMLVFLAHWCPHCQKEMPAIVALQQSGKIPADVEVVGIATGTFSNRPNFPPSAWFARENWPGSIIADDKGSTIASAFGLTSYPLIVFIDSEGTVSKRLAGEQPDSAIISAASAISTQ